MTFSAAAFYLAYLGLAVLHRHRQRQKVHNGLIGLVLDQGRKNTR